MLSMFRKIASSVIGSRADVEEQHLDFDEIAARLQLAKIEVDRLKEQVVNEISSYYDKMVNAVRSGDSETLELTAAEVVLKKKILTSVITYSKLLSLAIQRIRDARDVETLVRVLAPLEYTMRAAGDYMASVSPETVMRINSVLEATERVVRSTHVTASLLPRASVDLDPEVREEIAKVVAEASRESESLIPTSKDNQDLENTLLDYIKGSGGTINISKAAKELNTTPEAVKAALESLQSRGLIKVYKRQLEHITA